MVCLSAGKRDSDLVIQLDTRVHENVSGCKGFLPLSPPQPLRCGDYLVKRQTRRRGLAPGLRGSFLGLLVLARRLLAFYSLQRRLDFQITQYLEFVTLFDAEGQVEDLLLEAAPDEFERR